MSSFMLREIGQRLHTQHESGVPKKHFLRRTAQAVQTMLGEDPLHFFLASGSLTPSPLSFITRSFSPTVLTFAQKSNKNEETKPLPTTVAGLVKLAPLHFKERYLLEESLAKMPDSPQKKKIKVPHSAKVEEEAAYAALKKLVPNIIDRHAQKLAAIIIKHTNYHKYTQDQPQAIAKSQVIEAIQSQIELAHAGRPNSRNVQSGTLIAQGTYVPPTLEPLDLDYEPLTTTIFAPGRPAPSIPEEKTEILDTTIDLHAKTLPELYTGANGRIYNRDNGSRYLGSAAGKELATRKKEHDPYRLPPEVWNNGIPDPAIHVITKDSVHSLHVTKFRAIGYVVDERGYVYRPITSEKTTKRGENKKNI